MTKHFVEYLYPGSFFSESIIEEVLVRDIFLPVKTNGYLGEPFGYRFYDQTIVNTSTETLTGSKQNVSGTYYFGKTYSQDEVKLVGGTDILVDNMRMNRWEKVVKTNRGNFQPFDSTKDFIVPS
ncbi:hypothetical protein CLV58_1196 [Spirosoma oryzae]|uniref:Uncharacterized protein n=1 Tax=Spirosoma oryzae TaxID=1469603 RepID=A0A2T0SKB5_9BACT|nr:hypothetical protein [Spirosoma oryzae]PRY33857.1 hypothetical protein CLV58_1196 [Spirosoma oryzae]